jgi:hypothetical protein
LGSEPVTGFTAARGNSIVEQAADPVDVSVDRERQQVFVRTDSRLRRHDISCRSAIFGAGSDGACIVRPPERCGNGHRLAPGYALVGSIGVQLR